MQDSHSAMIKSHLSHNEVKRSRGSFISNKYPWWKHHRHAIAAKRPLCCCTLRDDVKARSAHYKSNFIAGTKDDPRRIHHQRTWTVWLLNTRYVLLGSAPQQPLIFVWGGGEAALGQREEEENTLLDELNRISGGQKFTSQMEVTD